MKHSMLANGQFNEDVKMYKRFFRGDKYIGNGTFLEIGKHVNKAIYFFEILSMILLYILKYMRLIHFIPYNESYFL